MQTPASETPPVMHVPARHRAGVRRRAVNPRSAYIRFRMTPAQRAGIVDAAKAAGLTITGYLFSRLDGPEPAKGETRAGGNRQAVADPVILARLLGEIGKLGSNHNQLAHAFNAVGQTPQWAEYQRQGQAIFDMRRALLEALGYADKG